MRSISFRVRLFVLALLSALVLAACGEAAGGLTPVGTTPCTSDSSGTHCPVGAKAWFKDGLYFRPDSNKPWFKLLEPGAILVGDKVGVTDGFTVNLGANNENGVLTGAWHVEYDSTKPGDYGLQNKLFTTTASSMSGTTGTASPLLPTASTQLTNTAVVPPSPTAAAPITSTAPLTLTLVPYESEGGIPYAGSEINLDVAPDEIEVVTAGPATAAGIHLPGGKVRGSVLIFLSDPAVVVRYKATAVLPGSNYHASYRPLGSNLPPRDESTWRMIASKHIAELEKAPNCTPGTGCEIIDVLVIAPGDKVVAQWTANR